MYTSTGHQACVGYDTPCVVSVATQRKHEVVAQLAEFLVVHMATKYQLAVVHLDFKLLIHETISLLKITKVHPYTGPPSSLNMLKLTLTRTKSRKNIFFEGLNDPPSPPAVFCTLNYKGALNLDN
jgi:hypothetical protein